MLYPTELRALVKYQGLATVACLIGAIVPRNCTRLNAEQKIGSWLHDRIRQTCKPRAGSHSLSKTVSVRAIGHDIRTLQNQGQAGSAKLGTVFS
jgi:hypothetical protein